MNLWNTRKSPKLARELSGKISLDLWKAFQRFFIASILISPFSEVFKARAKNDNKFVAMKRVLMENEKEGARKLLNIFHTFPNLSKSSLVSDYSTPWNPHSSASETRKCSKSHWNLPYKGEQEQQIQIDLLFGVRLLRTWSGRFVVKRERKIQPGRDKKSYEAAAERVVLHSLK